MTRAINAISLVVSLTGTFGCVRASINVINVSHAFHRAANQSFRKLLWEIVYFSRSQLNLRPNGRAATTHTRTHAHDIKDAWTRERQKQKSLEHQRLSSAQFGRSQLLHLLSIATAVSAAVCSHSLLKAQRLAVAVAVEPGPLPLPTRCAPLRPAARSRRARSTVCAAS